MQILRQDKKEKNDLKGPKRSFFLNIPIKKIVITILSLFIILLIWEKTFVYFDIPLRIAPKPSILYQFIHKEFFTQHSNRYQTVLVKSLYSLKDAGIGFFLSLILGSILGILISQNNLLNSILFPFLFLTQLIPVPALAPIVAVYLGYSTTTKIFIIILFNIFSITVAVRKAIINLPEHYLLLLYSYTKEKKYIFKYLLLPSLVPTLLINMKLLTTASIVASIVTELPLSVKNGIGKDIYNSFNNLLIARVWVSIAIISILSLLFFIAISKFGNYINKKYRYGQFQCDNN